MNIPPNPSLAEQQTDPNFFDRFRDGLADLRMNLGRIAAASALVMVGMAVCSNSAEAACSGTHCDPQGTLELAGSSWLGGSGVDIYANNGDAGYDSNVNEYVTTPSGSSVETGEEWQCVELINRLYLTKGWITNTWYGNGNTIKDSLPSGLTFQADGSITSITPGDVITLTDKGAGHAGIINS